MGSIRLHEKHGVNPLIPTCFFCGEPKNELILAGAAMRRLTGFDDGQQATAHKVVIDKSPCDKCAEFMKLGVIVITVDEAKSNGNFDNPYRTGGWFVISDDGIRRMEMPAEMTEQILKQRVAFIEHEAAVRAGMFEAAKDAPIIKNTESKA